VGKVTVDGEPLRVNSGTVTFKPDRDKGNDATVEPSGSLEKDGIYTLYFAPGKKGAPPGWYKVQVVASQVGPGMKMPRPANFPAPPAEVLFNSKFTSTETSGLEIEVVKDPAPGAYDLPLTK
jgi:hypothetical protein